MNIKVTKIANKWHARLFNGDKLVDETACQCQKDIGWICREMLTWVDKCGLSNSHTRSARIRHNEDCDPVGKIWRNLARIS